MEITQELLDKLSKHDLRHYQRTGQLIFTSDYGDRFGVIKIAEPVTETVVIDDFKIAEPVTETVVVDVEDEIEEPVTETVVIVEELEPTVDEEPVIEPVVEEVDDETIATTEVPVVEVVETVVEPIVEEKVKKGKK